MSPHTLAGRAQLPEDIAATSLAHIAHFSLSCMFAQMPVDTFLGGVFLMQSITYWRYQSNDKLWTRCIVIFTSFFALGFTIYIWWFTGYLSVENYGKFAPFTQTENLAPFPFLNALNSAVVQSFFCHRAYLLIRRQIWLPIVILIATSVGATLWVLIVFSGLSAVAEAHRVFVPELLWLTSIMTADLLITVVIIYGLTQSKTGWINTDRTISKLIRLTLESQMPPTLISLAFMIEFVITPSSLLGAFFQGIQSKFYAVGLMYALNQRIKFKQSITDTHTAGGQVFAMSNRGPTQIHVDVETYVQDSAYPSNAYASQGKKDLDSASDLNDKALGYSSQARLTEPQSHIVLT